MEFELKIRSKNFKVIKEALYSVLDKITEHEVLALDKEIHSSSNPQTIFIEFESLDGDKKPKRNPNLLVQWTHYRWLRLELFYLATQKCLLNQTSDYEQSILYEARPASDLKEIKSEAPSKISSMSFKDFQKKIVENPTINRALEIPALVNSINRAIQEDAQRGASISASIQVLRQITLQIVGTEHPTDPLSQEARDILYKIAQAMDIESPKEEVISKLIYELKNSDSIPPYKHQVVEEVNRNIKMTLDKLYDSLPLLVDAILNAYKTYYGLTLYNLHKEEILKALEGGLQPNGQVTSGIVRDVSWAGFDADGNDNITPERMRYAIRLHRIRAAEKHSENLEHFLIEKCQKIERQLKQEITQINGEHIKLLQEEKGNSESLIYFHGIQNKASQYLIEKDYDALVKLYQDQYEIIKKQYPKNTVFTEQQYNKSVLLQLLTRFSGTYHERSHDKELKGTLQQLKDIFENYKNAIRDNSDAFEMKDEKGVLQKPNEYIFARYHKIFIEHAKLFQHFPELKIQMKYFGIQLHCFRMTYGLAHVRQDSSVHVKVWNTLFDDLQQDKQLEHFAVMRLLNHRQYINLKLEERTKVHTLLLNENAESNIIFAKIFHNHHAKIYVHGKTYKDNTNFVLVRRELERYELAVRNHDIVENIIISNAENSANLFEVESFKRIFTTKPCNITTVPLLEKRQDLDNFELVLIDFIKFKIQQRLESLFDQDAAFLFPKLLGIKTKPEIKNFIHKMDREAFKKFLNLKPELKKYLTAIEIEVMFGYSDTARVSGPSVLHSIKKAQETFLSLTQDFGVTAKLFHGPGGDLNRGGLKRRDRKMTLQGNARSNILNFSGSTLRFRETQFYAAYAAIAQAKRSFELISMPSHIKNWADECQIMGAEFYEFLLDTKKGLGKLFGFMQGQGAHWLVSILNSSSRATQRGIAENQGDRTSSVQVNGIRPDGYIDTEKLRAISATQMNEMLRHQCHLIIGPGYAFRQLGTERVQRLYDSSETFRDIFVKTVLGLVLADFSIAAYGLFADFPELIPRNPAERKAWAKECKETFPLILEALEIEKVIKTTSGKDKVIEMMGKFFAFIEEEYHLTLSFLFTVMKSIHCWEYHQKDAPKVFKKPSDLLYCYPTLKLQVEDVITEAHSLHVLFARQTTRVSRGDCLDVIYKGINDEKHIQSKLSGLGSLIGNVGAGITAFRIMLPTYYDDFCLDYKTNLRDGIARGEMESIQLGKTSFLTHLKPITSIAAADQKENKKSSVVEKNIWQNAKFTLFAGMGLVLAYKYLTQPNSAPSLKP